MEEQNLYEQNLWWKDRNLIEEDYDILKWKEKKYKWIPDVINKIGFDPFSLHILLGPRQAGKTTSLKLLIKKLLEIKNPKAIFYFNCENLADYKELSEILNLYLDFREKYNITNSYIILDEITLPKEWYRAIKFFIDLGKFKNDVVILTGSSSISIKRETELFPGRRGKGKDFVMFPLSFRGFLKIVASDIVEKIPAFRKIEDIESYTSKAILYEKELNKYLDKYMEYGGFPLSVANLDMEKEEAKEAYLSWIINAVLKADRSDLIARQIIKVIIETLQSDVSWEGISKKIEIKSPKTVSAYIDLLKSIYAVNVLYNIDVNGKKIRFGKNKKIHLRDPLLLEILEDWTLVKANDKKSAIAEALVIEHLERAFEENVFFWKNGFEIDGIVMEKEKLYGFEVKWKEKASAKGLHQLKKFYIITKKEYSKKDSKIPLSVFLSGFDV